MISTCNVNHAAIVAATNAHCMAVAKLAMLYVLCRICIYVTTTTMVFTALAATARYTRTITSGYYQFLVALVFTGSF